MKSDFFVPCAVLENLVLGIRMTDKESDNARINGEDATLSLTPLSKIPWHFHNFLAALQMVVSCHALDVWLADIFSRGESVPDLATSRFDRGALVSLIRKHGLQAAASNTFCTMALPEAFVSVAIKVVEELQSFDRVREAILVEYFTSRAKEISSSLS